MRAEQLHEARTLVEGSAPGGVADRRGGLKARLDVRCEPRMRRADPVTVGLPCLPLLERSEGLEPALEVPEPHLARDLESALDAGDFRPELVHVALVDHVEGVREDGERSEVGYRPGALEQHLARAREYPRVAGEPAHRVEAGGERHHVVEGHGAVSGAEAEYAAVARGHADGAARVGAEGEVDESRGDGRDRSAG